MKGSEVPDSRGVQEEVGTTKWGCTVGARTPTLIRGASISWGHVAHYKWGRELLERCWFFWGLHCPSALSQFGPRGLRHARKVTLMSFVTWEVSSCFKRHSRVPRVIETLSSYTQVYKWRN